MRALKYAFDEARLSLWRGRRAAALSLATIAVAMFVLGGFLLLLVNAQRIVQQWSLAAEFSVYLRDDATAAQRSAIQAALGDSGIASTVDYLSKDEAARRFMRDFPDLAGSVDLGDHNPLPASLELRVGPARAEDELRQVADRIRSMNGVADVRYDRRWLERLMSIIQIARALGAVLGSVLVVGAALTVASVVRLALHARRDEIHIMQLVGAPLTFIQGPFVLEGVIQGGTGALLALAALGGLFAFGHQRFESVLVASSLFERITFLPPLLCAVLVAGGMAVGCLGGLVAARAAK